MRIGLLGGSFNPAHEGHLYISNEAHQRFGLTQVWWLVSPQNPLKNKSSLAPLKERIASAQKITSGSSYITITSPETAFGSNYSFDTIRHLQMLYPWVDFIWIMGADNLVNFHRWHRWAEIFGLLPIAIFDRAPYTLKATISKAAKRFAPSEVDESSLTYATLPAWHYVRLKPHPASSTEIRNLKI